ncbi:MAG: glycosyltransferase family 1 protein [Firmicutes bacterium]|nr:glycosyltransferase family 1 protein [Bacillota bacterium]
MNTLRVGLLTYGMSQHLTGIGRYARELTYAFRRLGVPLHLVLLNPYPESPLSWYRDFETFPLPRLRRLPGVLAFGPLDLPAAQRRLRLDIIHDPCGIAPFVTPRTPRYARLVTIHDAIPLVHPEYQPWLTRFVYRTYLAKTPATVDGIITTSTASRLDLMRHLHLPEDRLHVTRLGTRYPTLQDLHRWRGELPSLLRQYRLSQPYYLYVGSAHKRKNIAGSLQAFERVHRHHPETTLALVGPPPPGQPRMPPGVRRLGFVPDAHLDVLYYGATALVFPSFYEGFGLPALEALAHGTPVIASNLSSLPEVVGLAGFLVNPRNLEELQQAMEACLRPDVRLRLFHAGRERAEEFSWERTAWETWAIYQRVTGRAHAKSLPETGA